MAKSTPPHTVAGSFVAPAHARVRLGDELTVIVRVRCVEERVTARGDRAVLAVVQAEVLDQWELQETVGGYLADRARSRGDGVHPDQQRLGEEAPAADVAASVERHPSNGGNVSPANRVSAARLKAAGLTQPEYLAACELVATEGWTVAAPKLEAVHSAAALELVRATIGQTMPHGLGPLPPSEVVPMAGRRKRPTRAKRTSS